MSFPQEHEFFPLNPSIQLEAQPLFGSSSSSTIPPPQDQQNATERETPEYKGVVPQQNDHWGAQIYLLNNQIWLGTFESKTVAARAYDSAAIKLNHGADIDRNIPLTNITVHEREFQEPLSTETVLNMIQDGSYESRLIEFISSNENGSNQPVVIENGRTLVEMFQKELTPSDVGKLNRLVIPKKHAQHHFPDVSTNCVEQHMLEFRDRMNRRWEFRYCYWKSSQSFVFTRGWNQFVRQMQLRAGDSVVFYLCTEMDGLNRETFFMIDVVRRDGEENGAVEDGEGSENHNRFDEEEARSEKSQRTKEVKLFGARIK